MSARFAENARRLCGLAAWALGWRPGDFWSATPSELASIGAALDAPVAPPPDPAQLARLIETYPDVQSHR